MSFDINQYLQEGKNKFLDESHLDWMTETYHREYVDFLELDYKKLLNLATENLQNDLTQLTTYIDELNDAYQQAKKYLLID